MTNWEAKAREIVDQLSVSAKYNQYCLDNDKRTSEQFNYFDEQYEKKAMKAITQLHHDEVLRVIDTLEKNSTHYTADGLVADGLDPWAVSVSTIQLERKRLTNNERG